MHISNVTCVPYLGFEDQPSPEVHQAKRAIHEEFSRTARITGEVAMIFFTNSHAELEVEGQHYSYECAFLSYPYFSGECHEEHSLDTRTCRERRKGRHVPFVRLDIRVTPQELDRLRQDVDQLLAAPHAITCSDGIAMVLRRTANIAIPRLFSLLPSHLAVYLGLASRRVGSIQMVASNWKLAVGAGLYGLAWQTLCVAGPILMAGGLVMTGSCEVLSCNDGPLGTVAGMAAQAGYMLLCAGATILTPVTIVGLVAGDQNRQPVH